MSELDAYIDAYTAWEKQASRLSELITLMDNFVMQLKDRPPFNVPPGWPSREQLLTTMAAAMAAWAEMVAKYQMIPNDKKSFARPLPVKTGYRQPIA